MTNNAISLTPNHPLLLLAMEKLTKSYQPKCWDCIGPPLLTKSIMEFAGTRFVQNVPKSINIKLVPLFRFVDFLSERIEKLIKKTEIFIDRINYNILIRITFYHRISFSE